jgi:hypothetical protein
MLVPSETSPQEPSIHAFDATQQIEVCLQKLRGDADNCPNENKAGSITKIYSLIKVLIDVVICSEYELLIKCGINPGSVERSIDLSI